MRIVAPLAGARIEIRRKGKQMAATFDVAPLAGARIEIHNSIYRGQSLGSVAPLAGARIEIGCLSQGKDSGQSLPSRERGLKC